MPRRVNARKVPSVLRLLLLTANQNHDHERDEREDEHREDREEDRELGGTDAKHHPIIGVYDTAVTSCG